MRVERLRTEEAVKNALLMRRAEEEADHNAQELIRLKDAQKAQQGDCC